MLKFTENFVGKQKKKIATLRPFSKPSLEKLKV